MKVNRTTKFDAFETHHRNLFEAAVVKYPKHFTINDILQFDNLMTESKNLLVKENLMKHWNPEIFFNKPEDFLPKNSVVIMENICEHMMHKTLLEEGWFDRLKQAGTSIKNYIGGAAEKASKALTPKEAVGAIKAQREAMDFIQDMINNLQNEKEKQNFQTEWNNINQDLTAAQDSGFMQSLVGRLYKGEIKEQFLSFLGAPAKKVAAHGLSSGARALARKAATKKALLTAQQIAAKKAGLSMLATGSSKGAALTGAAAKSAAAAKAAGGVGAKLAAIKAGGIGLGAGGAAGGGGAAAAGGGGAAAAGGIGLGTVAGAALGTAALAAAIGAGVAGARLKARREKIQDLMSRVKTAKEAAAKKAQTTSTTTQISGGAGAAAAESISESVIRKLRRMEQAKKVRRY